MTEQAFTAAAEQHLDMVYRIALNCLRVPADAEDAAQTVLLRLWQSDTEFAGGEHLRYWLARVTVNVCRDMTRSPWRRRTVSLDSCREPVFQDPEHRELYEAVMALPAKYRVAIHLFYYEDYSVEEIAAILHITPGNVKTRLSRGRSALRGALQEAWDNDES